MIPRLIHLLITSVKFTSIRFANSLTLINSVNCSLLPSSLSPAASAASSRFALRYFAFKLLPRPPAPASLPVFPYFFLYFFFVDFFVFSCRSVISSASYARSSSSTASGSTGPSSATTRSAAWSTTTIISLESFISSIFIFYRIFSFDFFLLDRDTFAFCFSSCFGRVSFSTGNRFFQGSLVLLICLLLYFQ